MNTRRSISKFVSPSDLAGEWSDCRGTYFWHEKTPYAMKKVVEKMTGMPLRRDTTYMPQLSYGGATRGGGELQTVWFRLEAVIDSRNLYSLVLKRTAPRRWVSERAFLKATNKDFVCWCAKLRVPSTEIAWPQASPLLLEQVKQASIAREATPAPALDAVAQAKAPSPARETPYYGKVFFTAHSGEGARIFDSAGFFPENHNDAVTDCLRSFFDWDSRHGVPPYRPERGNGWKHIVHQLKACNV